MTIFAASCQTGGAKPKLGVGCNGTHCYNVELPLHRAVIFAIAQLSCSDLPQAYSIFNKMGKWQMVNGECILARTVGNDGDVINIIAKSHETCPIE